MANEVDIEACPLKFAKTKDGRHICYQDLGNPTRPCILLIMGMNGTLADWDNNFCAMFVEAGFRVVRFDNRDAGRSSYFDRSGTPRCFFFRGLCRVLCWCCFPRCFGSKRRPCGMPIAYDLHDMAEDAIELLDHLGVHKAHVVGGSMGGMIAQCLAIDHISRVASMCLLFSSGTLPVPWRILPILAPPPKDINTEGVVAHMTRKKVMLTGGRTVEDEERRHFEGCVRASLCHAKANDNSADLVPCFRQRLRGGQRQAVAIIQTPSRFKELGRALSPGVPVAILHGALDPMVTVSHGQHLHKAIPHSTLHVLPGMGHEVPTCLVERVCELIISNIRKADSEVFRHTNNT